MIVDGFRRAAVAALLVSCMATGGARAWQRPKAQAAAKAEACPAMGEGFVRVAGTDVCVRVAGTVRVEALHVAR